MPRLRLWAWPCDGDVKEGEPASGRRLKQDPGGCIDPQAGDHGAMHRRQAPGNGCAVPKRPACPAATARGAD